MIAFAGVVARVRSLLSGRQAEARMEEEFAFHLDMESKRLADEKGLSNGEARRRAMIAFGGLDTHREAMRDGRGARWFDDLGADARYALRAMRRTPGFAIAVALTLGVGIGMNGMVFGYVDSLLFRPVPAADAGRLVALFARDEKTGDAEQLGYQDFLDFRDRSSAFDGLAGMAGIPVNLVAPWRGTASDMVWGEMVTENFFTVLGMRPAAGRLFSEADGPQGANPVAVLSYESWLHRFGGDPSIVGHVVRVNGTGFTITGVAPRGFHGMRTFGFWPEIWVPIGMHDVAMPGSSRLFEGRGGGSMMAFGRMRAGMTIGRTEVAATTFARVLARDYPATNANLGAVVLPAKAGFDNPTYVKPSILTLASLLGVFASVVTLAVICANLASLQLARAAARSQEIAIRLSLGCSRARLVRQLVVESVMLTIPGAFIATGLIALGPIVESYLVPHLQFRVGFGVSADARVTLFTAVVATVAITLFGIAPAWRASKRASTSSLLGGRRTTIDSAGRLRGLLVIGQLALSVVLLVGATLFVRSLLFARGSDLGFDPRNRAMLSVNVGLQGYDEAQGRRFYDDVLTRVRAEPEVESAAWVFPAPFDTYGRSLALYSAEANSGKKDGTILTPLSNVADGFVTTLGLRLREGREFTPSDSEGGPRVMVVSRSLAARLWPGKNPIGQRARRNGAGGAELIVVGVVDDATFALIGETSVVRAYVPMRQSYRDWQTLIVHTRADPVAAVARLRQTVAAADPSLPVFGATTMDRAVYSGLAISRLAASVAGVFGLVALLISSIGLYAVVASGVLERTREIGVRMALGSTSRDVMKLVISGGARLGLFGLMAGLLGALFLARLMKALLFGLSPADPFTFVFVPAVLVIVVFAATWIPARRAVALDPVAALRSD